jgi:type IV secretion system protein VirB4
VGAEAIARERAVAQFLPYSHHAAPSVIATTDGDYLTTWQLAGRTFLGASREDLTVWCESLNHLLRGLAEPGLSLWTHVLRRRVREYPAGGFSNPFCRRLDQRYGHRFLDEGLLVNELYLSVIYRPGVDPLMDLFARRERLTPEQKIRRQAQALDKLHEIGATLEAGLRAYGPRRLGIYANGRHAYSSLSEFLGLLVNGEHLPMPICRDRLSASLPQARLFFDRWGEIGAWRTLAGDRYFGLLDLHDYPAETVPGQLDALLSLPFEHVLTQSFSPLSRSAAKAALQRQQKYLRDAQDVAYEQAAELDQALNDLISGKFVLGDHHMTLLVCGDDAEQVREHLAMTRSVMSDTGLIARPAMMAQEAAFWSQLPGNRKWRPRPAPITSLNFLSFFPLHNFPAGKAARNPWGPAAALLRTTAGGPFYFNFHATHPGEDAEGSRPLGHTMVLGASGAGKTVLLGFLLAQAQRFNPTAVVFDKDRGLEIAIRIMGGRYLPLAVGRPCGFNPLQLEPTPGNLDFVRELVAAAIASAGERVTHADREAIAGAVNTVMLHMPFAQRRFSMLLQSLPEARGLDEDARPSVAARLRPWCEGGEYGWLFDNPTDLLGLSGCRLFGFDMTEFLAHPAICSLTMMYLFHRMQGMIRGQPFLCFLDECWRALKSPYFQDWIEDKERTGRKQNLVLIVCTQEPTAITESAIGPTLVQQTATFLLLPNPRAAEEHYVQGLKLTPAEFDLVRKLPERSRAFVIKQGGEVVVAQLDLAGFAEELAVLSGTPDRARRLAGIMADVGSEPEDWLPVFFEFSEER